MKAKEFVAELIPDMDHPEFEALLRDSEGKIMDATVTESKSVFVKGQKMFEVNVKYHDKKYRGVVAGYHSQAIFKVVKGKRS